MSASVRLTSVWKLDPETNQTIPVTELCAKYATPANDVFGVGQPVDGPCELYCYYHPGGPKIDQNCVPHGGLHSEAIFCNPASCDDPTCAGQATISGIPIWQVPPVPLPLPTFEDLLSPVGITVTCE